MKKATLDLLEKLAANGGIIGIDPHFEVFHGYDGDIAEVACRDSGNGVQHLSKAEKLLLADEMIRRWTAYREEVEPGQRFVFEWGTEEDHRATLKQLRDADPQVTLDGDDFRNRPLRECIEFGEFIGALEVDRLPDGKPKCPGGSTLRFKLNWLCSSKAGLIADLDETAGTSRELGRASGESYEGSSNDTESASGSGRGIYDVVNFDSTSHHG